MRRASETREAAVTLWAVERAFPGFISAGLEQQPVRKALPANFGARRPGLILLTQFGQTLVQKSPWHLSRIQSKWPQLTRLLPHGTALGSERIGVPAYAPGA